MNINVLSICGHQISCKCEVASASCHFPQYSFEPLALHICESMAWKFTFNSWMTEFAIWMDVIDSECCSISHRTAGRALTCCLHLKKTLVFFSSALVDVECYVMHHGLPWIQNRRRKLCFHVFMILHVQFLYICARNSLLAFARMHMCERLRERAKWHLEMYHQILWWVYYYWHYCYNCCLLCIPFYIFIFILYSYTIFSSFSLALRQAPSVALTRVLSHLCKSNGLKTV